jgi:hypothetical protein
VEELNVTATETPAIQIGQIYSFSLPSTWGLRNHICKVQVVDRVPTDGGTGYYFLCRRIDNGHPVLAFEGDLRLNDKPRRGFVE